MTISLSLVKRKAFIYPLVFLGMIFLNSCSFFKKGVNTICLSQEEKASLESLFNYMLFEDSGVFVLFGSKPLCEMQFPPFLSLEESEKAIEQIPDEIKEIGHLVEVKTDYLKEWRKWKKIKNRFPIEKYLFAERGSSFFLIDKERTAQVIRENYGFFKKIIGFDFSPRKVVLEIEDQNSSFWTAVFQDHIAMGVLYGFGRKNAELFSDVAQNKSPDFRFSTTEKIGIFEANASHFTIPVFVSYRNDPMVTLYEKEKAQITRLYKEKDLFEVTLAQLVR